MAKAPPKVDREFLSVLARGAEKTFDNAERLYFEAELLAKTGSIARALCLHQISLEECSKVESIGAWVAGLLSGHTIDQHKVLADFRRHASKNKSNAFMLAASQSEKDARARGDWKTALEEFKKIQAQFHESSNDAKNASLYVDWKDGEFVSPTELITQAMLNEIIERNKSFLSYAFNSLKMLRRLEKSPEDLQDLVANFTAMIEQMHADNPDDPVTAGNEIVRTFVDAGLKRLRKKQVRNRRPNER